MNSYIETVISSRRFRVLPKDSKLLLVQLISTCNPAGVFPFDPDYLKFQLGLDNVIDSIEDLKSGQWAFFDEDSGEGISFEYLSHNNPYKSSTKQQQRYVFDRKNVKSKPISKKLMDMDKRLRESAKERLDVPKEVVKAGPLNYHVDK